MVVHLNSKAAGFSHPNYPTRGTRGLAPNRFHSLPLPLRPPPAWILTSQVISSMIQIHVGWVNFFPASINAALSLLIRFIAPLDMPPVHLSKVGIIQRELKWQSHFTNGREVTRGSDRWPMCGTAAGGIRMRKKTIFSFWARLDSPGPSGRIIVIH